MQSLAVILLKFSLLHSLQYFKKVNMLYAMLEIKVQKLSQGQYLF